MKIKNHTLKTEKNEVCVDLEISNIQYGNDSIGYYEYGSAREIDNQPDYIESFDIDEIKIEDLEITQKSLFEFLSDLLMDDDELYKKIEKLAKEEAESDKVERQLERRE
jgi:hypothetical protein